MSFSPSPNSVRFDDAQMWGELYDGRALGIPLVWFPWLLHAMPEQCDACFLSPSGIHGDEIDEDISIAGLLAGRGNQTRPRKAAA
jgi:hypothetical protein